MAQLNVPGMTPEQVGKIVTWLDATDDRRSVVGTRFDVDPVTDEEFLIWMVAVDARIRRTVGLGVFDIEDWCYRDAFDDGTSPRDAADDAIGNSLSGW